MNELFSQPYLTPVSWDNKAAAVGSIDKCSWKKHGKRRSHENDSFFEPGNKTAWQLIVPGRHGKYRFVVFLMAFQLISPLKPLLCAWLLINRRGHHQHPSPGATPLHPFPPGTMGTPAPATALREELGEARGLEIHPVMERQPLPCPSCPIPRPRAHAELPVDTVPMGARRRRHGAPAPKNLLDAAATMAQKD